MKQMQALTLAIVFLGATVHSAPSTSPKTPKCGYESCPATKPGMLNVHLLAHTHMDLGWLKTVDQYFYGTKNELANVGVRYIFDSVLDELEKDERRRFIFVETGFFNLWWKNVNETKKHRFDALVQSGRMEFISGGWVMNDEACVHYSNTIDQMTYGIRKLKDTFGNCGVPRIGWQIDPFGHSREYASLLAQMGMDGYFFGRLDYQDFKSRKTAKQLEFIWGASENLGTEANIFTGILPNTYSPPKGFCFDVYCSDDPIVDDPDSDEYNVDTRIDSFLTYARAQADYYKTNNIPVTMGNDFNYQSAGHWFINLDKLVKHANLVSEKTKIHLLYSTPSCYLKALHESGTKWSTKTDDFFPYASDPHAYWTGYFTSRAAFKYLDRYTNNQLQVAKQLGVLAGPKEVTEASLNVLREALAVGQHHDAITGTAKQAVANNYVKHIYIGHQASDKYTNYAFEKLLAKHPKAQVPRFVRCHTLNVSACEITESSTQITVLVYNPQGRPVQTHLRIPVSGDQWRVVDAGGSDVPIQVTRIPVGVAGIPERDSKADQEIIFVAKVPALGFATYFIEADNHYYKQRSRHHKKDLSMEKSASCGEPGVKEMRLQGKTASAVINCKSGLLSAISWKDTTVRVNQSFYWYEGHPGNNTRFQFRASGAYIFRPTQLEPLPVADKAELVHIVKNGSIVQEVHQKFSSWLTQVVRVYEDADFVEFDWVVGSIPVDDEVGKEVITRFDTELQTDELFYTDSNGREILERRRNFRPTWKLDVQEPVAGNYYPVNSRIYIRDTTRDIQLTVLTDRSQGGSSIRNGSVELMVHRRLLYDDAFGVGEALNESYYGGKGLVVRGTHRVIVSTLAQASLLHRPLAQALYAAPALFFSPVDATTYTAQCNTSCSALAKSLPRNVHLLTLEHWSEDKVLLRFEHFFEKKDHAGELSKPANFSLQASFVRTITSVSEMNLAVTKTKEEKSRLEFQADESNKALVLPTGNDKVPTTVFGPEYFVYLTPMQIRTFLVTFAEEETGHVMCFERERP